MISEERMNIMLSFLQIPNTERFLNLVDHCRGDVLLCLPDGSHCDLKQDPVARQMLRLMTPTGSGISVSLSNTKDTPRFLRYMLEAAAD